MSSSLLPPDFDFRQVDIPEKTLAANIALAELNDLILSIPNAEILVQLLVIREAVASSQIENIFLLPLNYWKLNYYTRKIDPKLKKKL